ncbi:MAG: hypothetical protein G01um101456_600 [Parcubacteria group bacterium Gr01-1014_56]|nr:MAG: hypothetical protein G01um101456_600 [Parcubacteria group bacterium Gr01-1014_56]
MEEKQKALLVPINSQNQMLIQDRRGQKKPDWGFFGGGIEEGETPLEAMIRESKEELDLEIRPEELEYRGNYRTVFEGVGTTRYFYLYRTEQETFTVLEGNGAHWVSFPEAMTRMEKWDTIDEVVQKIGILLSTDKKDEK